MKIRWDENRVLFAPFGAESSDEMSGWEPTQSNGSVRSFRRLGQRLGQGQIAPVCAGPHHCTKNGLKGIPAHHLMELSLSTRWWGIYEQDEYEQLKHIAAEGGR